MESEKPEFLKYYKYIRTCSKCKKKFATDYKSENQKCSECIIEELKERYVK